MESRKPQRSSKSSCQSAGTGLGRAMPVLRPLQSILLTVVSSLPLCAQDGKTLFTQHCAACHLADRQLVGPSLVEVSKLYTGKLDQFLAWCIEPQQKRQGVIQMPPMRHVGEGNLKLIHTHILAASKGVKEVKVKGLDPFYASPSMRKRPQVQRLFMPEAGPAAIAVAVNETLHYCWDAGSCRLRYIWKGDYIDGWAVWKGNGNGLAKIQGDVLLREERTPLPYPKAKPKFLGYKLVNGLPIFRYRLGSVEVLEEILPTSDGLALERTFTVTGANVPTNLTFTASDKVTYSSKKGSWKGTVLSTNPHRNGRFAVTITPKN